MKQQNKDRLAAILAAMLGLLSVKEGGSVLLGLTTKAYTVLPWLVWYNVLVGVFSVIVGVGLWQKRFWGHRFSVTVVVFHGLVLLILVMLFAFKQPVAVDSIIAMIVRVLVWAGIVLMTRGK